jgi:hypothetical protein
MLDALQTQNVILIIGAIAAGAVLIINALKKEQAHTREIVIAGQRAGAARGRVRDKAVHEIHIETNGRLTAALNLVLVFAKREADRTGLAEDVAAYQSALAAVEKNERIATKPMLDEDDHDVRQAMAAEAQLASLTERKAPA